VAGPCGYGNELSGSINGGEFSDQLSDYQLLERNSAPFTVDLILNFTSEYC
jgi:hypothetical protein